MVVIHRNGTKFPNYTKEDIENRSTQMKIAYQHIKSIMGNAQGGVHATPCTACAQLANNIGLKKGDCFWDIGCGEGLLAAAMSSITGRQTICTDTGIRNLNHPIIFIITLYFLFADYIQMILVSSYNRNYLNNPQKTLQQIKDFFALYMMTQKLPLHNFTL